MKRVWIRIHAFLVSVQDRRWAAAVAIALAALVAWSFSQRFTLLMESPFPVGVDGYFYPVQLRSLLDTGALAYPASPLSFYLMAPLAAVTDPITGAKLGAAVFGALIAVPAYGLGTRLGQSRGAGLVAAVLATTSAGSAFLTIEFVKNGIGLTVALTALWLILRALDTGSPPRIVAAAVGVVAAMLAHKMAAGIVIAVAIPAIVAASAGTGVRFGRRLICPLGAMLLVALGLLALGIAFPQRFLSGGDLDLVASLFGSQIRWNAPALVTPSATLAMGHEAAIGGVLAGLAGLALSHRLLGRRLRSSLEQRGLPPAPKLSPAETAASWAIVALGLTIAVPWIAVDDPQGLGFRLRIAAFVPMSLSAAIVSRALFTPIALAVRKLGSKLPARIAHELVIVVAATSIVVASPRRRTDGQIVTHPALVTAALALRGHIPAGDTAIIPERHIAFMLAWYAKVEVSTRPEPIPRARRWRVMPLHFIVAGSPLDQILVAARREPGLISPIGLHPRHPNLLVLVAEPTWEWILEQLPARDRAYFESWPVY